jgi:hypothetical protein
MFWNLKFEILCGFPLFFKPNLLNHLRNDTNRADSRVTDLNEIER